MMGDRLHITWHKPMKPGRIQSGHCWHGLMLALLLSQAGCLSAGKRREASTPPLPDYTIVASEVYTLACPDVVEVIFTDRPDFGQLAKIGPDGCIALGPLGNLRIEGLTAIEASSHIAERVGLPEARVLVQPVEYNSRQVFLFGPARGEQRAVDYRGPETVVDLLKRTGGLSPDAAPDQIFVVRALLGEGIPAEVLTIDLEAILEHNDHRTNVRIQPMDEIYVGEKPRSRIGKAVPTFLKPLYENLVELIPHRSSRPVEEEPKPAK